MEDIQQVFTAPVLIFGCGNILIGDDGFGPNVIKYLKQNCSLPSYAHALDVGTGIRNILFDLLLLEKKPRLIIIVDAVNYEDKEPGEVFEISLEDIPQKKVNDFSLHQFPTVNLLKELRNQGQIEVVIYVAQVSESPEAIKPGLSQALRKAIPKMCEMIIESVKKEKNP